MIVVTTPTGRIGRQVVERLVDRAADVRVIVRDPGRLATAVRDRVDVVVGSHDDPDVVGAAFAGADTVFWLVPPDMREQEPATRHLRFSRAARGAFAAAGVARVVGVSNLGRGTAWAADAGPVTASLAMDDAIGATGVAYRALVLPGFMENLLFDVAGLRDRGVFAGAASPTHAAPICATRDIAETAVRLLLDGSWAGVGEVPLLGPEDLSPDRQAEIMSDVLGRPVRYAHLAPDDYVAGAVARGASEAMARSLLAMLRAKDAGLDDAVPRTPSTAGTTTFAAWCAHVLRPAVLA